MKVPFSVIFVGIRDSRLWNFRVEYMVLCRTRVDKSVLGYVCKCRTSKDVAVS
jgi:hypothetical protein